MVRGSVAELVAQVKYKSKFCFEIRVPAQSRVFVIQADNDADASDWVAAINRSATSCFERDQ